MKNFGSVCEFASERSRDLFNAYLKHIAACKHIKMPEVCKHVVNMPSRRFWISAARAAVVVAAIERGDDISSMRPSKREMFLEIFRRYKEIRRNAPDLPVAHIVREIVEQPAPKFYLSPSSAKILILKARKLWIKEKSKKLQAFSSRHSS